MQLGKQGLYILFCTLLLLLTTTVEGQGMAGGYSPASVEDDEVVAAAEFCLDAMLEENNYSFGTTTDSQVQVIQASQQVVAGMNYQLVLAIQDQDESCLGAFTVIVYDRFGDLSVTDWGEEYTCAEAIGMLSAQEDSTGDAN